MWTTTGNDAEADQMGLVKVHAYSILGSYVVYNADGSEKAKLV